MRPSILHIGGTIYWTLLTRNPDTMVLKDADSTPSVAVRKNGASVADSVTVTKRSATTGIYDCSYNPAAEVEGDVFTLEESATVTGTTTAQATYVSSFNVRTVAVERGTDGANTTAPDNATIALIQAKTTNLPSDPADQSLIITATDAVMTRLGAPVGASVSADIAGVQSGVTTLLGRITATLFSGITSLGDWLRRFARKDAGTAGMITAEAEIDTGGTSTFTGITHSLEALADSSGLTEEQEETLNEILTRVSAVTITTTGYAQVDAEGVLQLKQGHTATLTFTSDTSNIVPDMSDATTRVFLGIKDNARRQWLQIEGTKLVNTGLQSVQFVLTAAAAAAMIQGQHLYDVVVLYGYNSSTDPSTYTALHIFTSGNTKISQLNVNLNNI